MDYIEDQKTIARFMGYTYNPNKHSPDHVEKQMVGWVKMTEKSPILKTAKNSGYYLARSYQHFRYRTSWDWIMPVVKKIVEIKDIEDGNVFFEFSSNEGFRISVGKISEGRCLESGNYNEHHYKGYSDSIIYNGSLKNVYEEVVNFLNWYKTCKKK